MDNWPFEIEMGAEVIDSVTGFKGKVTAALLYMTGCVQYQVEIAKDCELKSYWIDEQRLTPKKVKKKKNVPDILTVPKPPARRKRKLNRPGGGPSRGPSAY